MGRPRSADVQDDTPDRLLAAAAEAFAQDGSRATLADIARAAGIRRPSLLYHFATKDVLYAAVVRRTFEDLGAALAPAMLPGDSFVVRLEALVRSYVAFLVAHPRHSRVVVREMVENDGPGQRLLIEVVAPLLTQVLAFLERDGSEDLRPGLPLRQAVMQIAANALLATASGPVGPVLWGEARTSEDVAWWLCRHLVLREQR